MKGLGRTPSLGDRRGFMPPQLKTNKNTSLDIFMLCGVMIHGSDLEQSLGDWSREKVSEIKPALTDSTHQKTYRTRAIISR